MQLDTLRIAVIGLGYVGLPLAVEFGSLYPTVGFDINESRIRQLLEGHDATHEISNEEIKLAKHLILSNDIACVANCNFFIVTVPTPVDKHNRPDLSHLLNVSEMLGGVLKKGDTIVYESTVFPGCTEEECVPVLKKVSGLELNRDFYYRRRMCSCIKESFWT